MTVTCCRCQQTIGERDLSKRQVVTSFFRHNQGLCPGCFDRARAAIAQAYGQVRPGPGLLRPWPGIDGNSQ